MSDLPLLERDALDDIAALCQRAIRSSPSAEELDGALFAAEQPAVLRGDPTRAVVATVECADGAHVRLLAVDPEVRGEGRGHALVEAAEDDARAAGHRSLIAGADPPFFLWPGVPSTDTAMLCLFERHHYIHVDTNFNMTVDLGGIPEDPGGHTIATADDRDEVDEWITTHWSNWRGEAMRALGKGNLVLARGDDDIDAFCAFEVNRTGLLGPVAVRPDLIGRQRGRPALIGALHELRRRGRRSTDVCWVGPVVPYAAVGSRVTTFYFVYRRELR